jgi:hypothetical protein
MTRPTVVYEKWPCPACGRAILLTPGGALRAHSTGETGDGADCVGTGFNIFRPTLPQLTERGLEPGTRHRRKSR